MKKTINLMQGFTLLELLIVIGIISVLSAFVIAVADPLTQIKKTNDAKRKTDLAQIQRALESYYADLGTYPPNPGMDPYPSTSCTRSQYKIRGLDGNVVEWGSPFQPYMNLLPKDVDDTKTYVYYVTCDGQAYYLYASLERGADDPQVCNQGLVCASVPTGVTCGEIAVCNFGVSSPNVSP